MYHSKSEIPMTPLYTKRYLYSFKYAESFARRSISNRVKFIQDVLDMDKYLARMADRGDIVGAKMERRVDARDGSSASADGRSDDRPGHGMRRLPTRQPDALHLNDSPLVLRLLSFSMLTAIFRLIYLLIIRNIGAAPSIHVAWLKYRPRQSSSGGIVGARYFDRNRTRRPTDGVDKLRRWRRHCVIIMVKIRYDFPPGYSD